MFGSKKGIVIHNQNSTRSVVKESSDSPQMLASRNGVYFFGLALFAISFAVVYAAAWFAMGAAANTWGVIAGLAVAALVVCTVRIAPQWEKVVVLRLGRYNRTVGPGIYAVIPFIEHTAAHVDQRVITTTFYAEEALTEDLVPVDVDAVLFWVVWDPTKACIEVQDFRSAVVRSAQTALRDAIGCVELSELSYRRKQLDADVQKLMDDKVAEWGITISSVEIRNIYVPKELQDALSKEAQAKREREARITLAEAERDVSEIYVEAADVYGRNELAVKIRSMNLVNESVKERGGMMVVPSAYTEGFNQVEKGANTAGE